MAAPNPMQPQQQQQQAPQQHAALRSTLATPPTSMQGSRPSSASGGTVPLVNPFVEYESLGVIGRGKYSEVHRARSRRTGELVAVKKVSIFEMDSDGRKEVVNEANILQALPPHPHIIKYLHSYLYDNDLYLILELAESGDIALLMEQQRKKGSYFQEAEIWHYFVQIADALHAMHQCRVMHRDIKPANIFVTSSSVPSTAAPGAAPSSAAAAQGLHAIGLTIKLGDLGLGRYLSSKTYETFSMVGTPFYMSPEAIANTGYDFKSDIWSCGCLLYEMSALRSPFYSTSLNFYTLGNKITKAEYDRPPAHFSRTLHALIGWMVQPQPEARPDSGQVLRVAQMACESIARSGTVSDAIPVGGPLGNINGSRPASAVAAAAAQNSAAQMQQQQQLLLQQQQLQQQQQQLLQQQQQQQQQGAAAAAAHGGASAGMSDD